MKKYERMISRDAKEDIKTVLSRSTEVISLKVMDVVIEDEEIEAVKFQLKQCKAGSKREDILLNSLNGILKNKEEELNSLYLVNKVNNDIEVDKIVANAKSSLYRQMEFDLTNERSDAQNSQIEEEINNLDIYAKAMKDRVNQVMEEMINAAIEAIK